MSNGICDAFIAKISGEQGIDNKARYLLEDFFYEEGWASKTNASAMKEGFHQQFTYNKSRIAHFIEDFVRLFKEEFKTECKKHEDAFSEEEKPKVVILDDNELSIAKYAEEYPENFKEISDGLSEDIKSAEGETK